MELSKNSPIGVFDSGLGGISVLREALRSLPNENYIYYGDNLNAPYGDRTEAEITSLTLRALHHLVENGCKAIVIACNTATASCFEAACAQIQVPVIGIEPAIALACAQQGKGKVLMMATLATTRLPRYLALQGRMADPERVINIPCPGLVNRIEQGRLQAEDYDDLFDALLAPYEGLEADAIVLGCTHYPLIKNAFARAAQRHLSGACALYDGGPTSVRQLANVLSENDMANPKGHGAVAFQTSGDTAFYQPIFEKLLHADTVLAG
ncbi:MAG: glutamate racemase [Christensenellaceae bacterium]|jgi:glutamate racemase|nr:glutamate racemase [Christensenellaceae bacterium]